MAFSTTTVAANDLQGGGNYIDQPGWYHFGVIEAQAPPTKEDGTLIQNGVIGVKLVAYAGGPQDASGKFTQKGRKYDLCLFEPNLTHKDGGKSDQAKLTALLVAMSEVTEAQLVGGGEASGDETKWGGRQCLIQLEPQQEKKAGADGKEAWVDKTTASGGFMLRMAYSNILHVDHPKAKDLAKCDKSIAILPTEFRRPDYAKELAALEKAGGGSTNGESNGNGSSHASASAQQAAAGISDDDLGLD